MQGRKFHLLMLNMMFPRIDARDLKKWAVILMPFQCETNVQLPCNTFKSQMFDVNTKGGQN